ncbi:hypothetical protein BDF20DRAFT_804757, partial [Mycotypha africana]|uniref:uncharacterized protein n=1 Tax=Mycotypha africana TaxID=64632 RepID=UPI0023017A64
PGLSASLYVGELDPNVSESVLFKLFNMIGPVSSIRVCRDAITKKSLGYAYVNFHTMGDAERALEALNYTAILGRPCRIMWSQRDPALRRTGNGNIFIKNLDPSIDNKALHDTFSAFGNILSCKIAQDHQGYSKGYGFVHYETEEAAEDAIKNVNGMLLNDRKVFVGHHISRKERQSRLEEIRSNFTNLYIKNLSPEVDEEELRSLFASFGPITSAVVTRDEEGRSRGFGFVNFEQHDDAAKAVDELNATLCHGQPLYVSRAQKKNEREEELRRQYEQAKMDKLNKYQGVNLYVKNLEESIDDEQLREAFAAFGHITSAKVMHNNRGVSRGFGFVCFSSPEEATQAIAEMNGRMLGSKPIYVALAQRKDVRRSQLEAQMANRRGYHQQQQQQQQSMMGMGHPSQHHPSMYYGAPMPPHRGFIPQPMMQHPRYPMMHPSHNRPPRGSRRYNNNYSNNNNYHQQNNSRPYNNGESADASAAAAAATATTSASPANDTHTEGLENQLESLTLNDLNQLSPEDQKQSLGERLYPLINAQEPEYAGKITGMLLEMDNAELVSLINNHHLLSSKIQEAMDALKQHLA